MQKDADSILLIQWAGLGDMVLATPAILAIRKVYPNSRICFLTNSRSAEILKCLKEVDEVFTADGLSDIFNASIKLRARHFDLAVNLYRLYSFVGSLKMFLLFFVIGARVWVGRDTNKRGFFYHIRVPEVLPDNQHEAEHKLNVARALGSVENELKFKLECSKSDLEFVDDLLQNVGVQKGDFVIGINCATFDPKRNLSASFYGELAQKICSETGFKVVFTARDIDRCFFDLIMSNLKANVIDLVGKLTVGQLVAFIKRCNLFISPNSGPMHMAAAVSVPLVALFGDLEFNELRPYGNPRLIKVIKKPHKSITSLEAFILMKQLLEELK